MLAREKPSQRWVDQDDDPLAERGLIFAGLAHAVLALEREIAVSPLNFEEKVEIWAASERLNKLMHGGRNGA